MSDTELRLRCLAIAAGCVEGTHRDVLVAAFMFHAFALGRMAVVDEDADEPEAVKH